MKTFINYYGAKYRTAKMYPSPSCNVIIEPFAGAAGYSLHHYKHKVILFEKDDVLCEMWKWLISASASDIYDLPVDFNHIDEVDVPLGAKYLIGFCLNTGAASPCKTPSKWAKQYNTSGQFWGVKRRERIAQQVSLIKHWECHKVDDYSQIANIKATWFIDPPYQEMGRRYKHSCKNINFLHLASWSHERQGEIIVCEQSGADWMDWNNYKEVKANAKTKTSHEVWFHRVDTL
jgi:site-specific DNA-adenine methylase